MQVVCKKIKVPDTDTFDFLKLSLGELRSAACFLQAVFLSFLYARVTCKEAFLFQCGTAAFLSLKQSTGDTETDCVCLSGITAAVDVDENVVFAFDAQKGQGLFNYVLKNALREIVLESSFVNLYNA